MHYHVCNFFLAAVLGGFCGFYGCCGGGVAVGIFLAIVQGCSPLHKEEWSCANKGTSSALSALAQIGGPRCWFVILLHCLMPEVPEQRTTG